MTSLAVMHDGFVGGGGDWNVSREKSKNKNLFYSIFMFSKRIQSSPSFNVGWWLCHIAIPSPPQRSRWVRWLLRGGGGIAVFQEKIKIKKYYFLIFFNFLEIVQSHPSLDRAVMHDGSSMGAGGLERNRAINQIFLFFIFFPWNISVLVEVWGIVQVPSTEQRDSLERCGKEVSSRS
jgi:hypothetical protein